MATSLLNVLMDDTKTYLELKLKTEISDTTKVGLVDTGEFQGDASIEGINVTVYPGDESWRHVLNLNPGGMRAPMASIGGGYGSFMWRERFYVKVEAIFDGEPDRDSARTRINVVLSRARHELLKMTMPQSADSFGERATAIQVFDAYARERGASERPIWDVWIRIEFITEIAPT